MIRIARKNGEWQVVVACTNGQLLRFTSQWWSVAASYLGLVTSKPLDSRDHAFLATCAYMARGRWA